MDLEKRVEELMEYSVEQLRERYKQTGLSGYSCYRKKELAIQLANFELFFNNCNIKGIPKLDVTETMIR